MNTKKIKSKKVSEVIKKNHLTSENKLALKQHKSKPKQKVKKEEKSMFVVLREALEKIGWELRDHGCNYYYMYNHKGNGVSWYVYGLQDPRIEHQPNISYSMSCVFYLKHADIELSEDEQCVSVVAKGNREVFVQFYNHDKPKPHKT